VDETDLLGDGCKLCDAVLLIDVEIMMVGFIELLGVRECDLVGDSVPLFDGTEMVHLGPVHPSTHVQDPFPSAPSSHIPPFKHAHTPIQFCP